MMVIDVAMRYIYPVHMRKGVIIGRVVVVVVVSTKIAIYRDVGIYLSDSYAS